MKAKTTSRDKLMAVLFCLILILLCAEPTDEKASHAIGLAVTVIICLALFAWLSHMPKNKRNETTGK